MNMKKKTIKFARTSKGIPALWESLKKFPNMKRITCIFNENAETIEPIFSRIGSNSSLIPIKENYLILKIFFDDEGYGISILRLNSIDCYSNNAEVEIIKRKASGSDNWVDNETAQPVSNDIFVKLNSVIEKILSEEK